MSAAKVLTSIIEAKPNKLSFGGKTYLCFEDWQTLGRFYGVTVAARQFKSSKRNPATSPARSPSRDNTTRRA